MIPLVEYISGRGPAPSRRDLNKILERYEWFTTARRARVLVTGEPDQALLLPSMFRPTVPPRLVETPAGEMTVVADAVTEPSTADTPDLIDRFIEHGAYRIVPADDSAEVQVDVDIDPEMVSEELAEIYRAQGLTAEAEKIDRILKKII